MASDCSTCLRCRPKAKCLQQRRLLHTIVPRRQGQTWRRATKFPNPLFDKALAERKTDKSWNTIETNSYHIVMLDEPQRLAETLMTAA